MRHRTLRFATLISFAAAAGLVFLAAPSSSTSALPAALIGSSALRTNASAHLREYTAALRLCRDKLTAGEVVACPDINDSVAMKKFLAGASSSSSTAHAAAPKLTLSTVDEHDRSLLRWYQKVGACPDTLDTIADGLYDLCISLVGERGEKGKAQQILNQLTPPPQSVLPTWTLDDFIKATSRRPPIR